MFGKPGSLTMYSTSERGGIFTSDLKCYAGPADYEVTTGNIRKRDETVAPFDTSAKRNVYKVDSKPSPAEYFPQLQKNTGTAIMKPDYFPANLRVGAKSAGPGPAAYKPLDQFTKLMIDAKMLATKRPRVNFEKFISNSCPTIYHPEDIRCFVEGIDGRMYPWRIDRVNKSPGPKYNTYGVTTSRTRTSPVVNFSNSAPRPELFKIQAGFGPADFTISRDLEIQGGTMLGRTTNPKKSALRYFDLMEKKTLRDHVPTPFSHSIPSCFDNYSPKAVSAPFKSKTKRGQSITAKEGPGPAAHFKQKIPLDQVTKNPKIFGITTFPPTASIIKSFNTTEPRFFNLALNELDYHPSPDTYNVPGLADELEWDILKHRSAFRNPKLGFLVSSEARPILKKKLPPRTSSSSPRRAWKNMRPRPSSTYPFHGPPPKYGNSPGPIYDSNPGFIATKAKRTWNDPRKFLYNTAFWSSGCARVLNLGNIDKDTPGPGKYYSMLPVSNKGGKLSRGQQRFIKSESVGPGPVHKLHEKMDSSIWKASHLGTFNSKLKQIGIVYPNAGGFRGKVLNTAADKAWRIQRKDSYAEILKNPKETKLLASVLRVSKTDGRI